MTWDSSRDYTADIGDDPGPWQRHVKTVWRAASSVSTDVRVPRRPPRPAPGAQQDAAATIAFWAAPLQLLVFGLGWRRPDIGLLRWRDVGYPTLDDPVLTTLRRWWKDESVLDIVAWSHATGGALQVVGSDVRPGHHDPDPVPLPPGAPLTEFSRRRQDAAWTSVWGGGSDPLHLVGHARIAVEVGPEPRDELSVGGAGRSALLLDRYQGWYAKAAETLGSGMESVDVVVRPVGWLGTYRRSPSTGVAHRTSEEVHLWGWPEVVPASASEHLGSKQDMI